MSLLKSKKVASLESELKHLSYRTDNFLEQLTMLGQARQITIQSLRILRQTTDENNRGRLKKINKKAARIAQRIQWGIPESDLMRELRTKNSPGAAWVLASRLADTLGDLGDWKREDWDQYIKLLKKGLTDSSIPTLNISRRWRLLALYFPRNMENITTLKKLFFFSVKLALEVNLMH